MKADERFEIVLPTMAELIANADAKDPEFGRFMLRECAKSLRRGETPPPAVSEYIVDRLDKICRMKNPAESNVVAEVLNLVGRPGGQRAPEWVSRHRVYEYAKARKDGRKPTEARKRAAVECGGLSPATIKRAWNRWHPLHPNTPEQ